MYFSEYLQSEVTMNKFIFYICGLITLSKGLPVQDFKSEMMIKILKVPQNSGRDFKEILESVENFKPKCENEILNKNITFQELHLYKKMFHQNAMLLMEMRRLNLNIKILRDDLRRHREEFGDDESNNFNPFLRPIPWLPPPEVFRTFPNIILNDNLGGIIKIEPFKRNLNSLSN